MVDPKSISISIKAIKVVQNKGFDIVRGPFQVVVVDDVKSGPQKEYARKGEIPLSYSVIDERSTMLMEEIPALSLVEVDRWKINTNSLAEKWTVSTVPSGNSSIRGPQMSKMLLQIRLCMLGLAQSSRKAIPSSISRACRGRIAQQIQFKTSNA